MLNTEALTLVQADETTLFRLNRFYKRNGHRGKASKDHLAYWLEADQTIIAGLRLEPMPWGNLLRGLWVAKQYRGLGAGQKLLNALRTQLSDAPCYYLPYVEQEAFYQRNGFQDAHDTAPADLIKQWRSYLKRGEQLALMHYKTDQPPCD